MTTFKTLMSSAAALSLVFVGTAAKAEAIRSGAATPGVVSVKKAKLARTTAPRKNESKGVSNAALGGGAAIVAGLGIYLAVDGDDDSPAG